MLIWLVQLVEHTAGKQNARHLLQAIELDAEAHHVLHQHKQEDLVACALSTASILLMTMLLLELIM